MEQQPHLHPRVPLRRPSPPRVPSAITLANATKLHQAHRCTASASNRAAQAKFHPIRPKHLAPMLIQPTSPKTSHHRVYAPMGNQKSPSLVSDHMSSRHGMTPPLSSPPAAPPCLKRKRQALASLTMAVNPL